MRMNWGRHAGETPTLRYECLRRTGFGQDARNHRLEDGSTRVPFRRPVFMSYAFCIGHYYDTTGEKGLVPQEPFCNFFEDFVPEEPFFVKPAARRPGGGVFFDPKGEFGPDFCPVAPIRFKKGRANSVFHSARTQIITDAYGK
jgi:hypothetical protein